MNNAFLAQTNTESVWRLALGVRPVDALRSQPVAQPVQVDLETGDGWQAPASDDAPYARHARPGTMQPLISRTDTGGHILHYHRNFDRWVSARGRDQRLTIRIFDRYRRYVPRRLSVPVVPEADADTVATFARRVLAPSLYPGAAYPLVSGSTGLRGRAIRATPGLRPPSPLRWARIVARMITPPADVVGRAFSDDRGEFLLLLRSNAFRAAELMESVALRVVVSAPAVVPASPPEQAAADEWWDLPNELIPAAEDPQPVFRGEVMPDGYATSAGTPRTVRFRIGRVLTGLDEPDFMFSL